MQRGRCDQYDLKRPLWLMKDPWGLLLLSTILYLTIIAITAG